MTMSSQGGASGAPPLLFVIGPVVIACSARVGRVPGPGESVLASRVVVEAGGKAFNVAVAARRSGIAVDGVLAIGDDEPAASLARAAARRADLPQTILQAREGRTAAGIGFIGPDGETCVAVDPGASGRLGAADLRAASDRLRRARLVYASFEAGDEAILEAFALARSAGLGTLLNPSPYRPPPPALLARTGVLVVNRAEAAALAADLGLDEDAATPRGFEDGLARALLARGVTLAVMTLGSEGAIAATRRETVVQEAFPVEAVDSLGAGDAFTGALAAGLLGGRDLARAMRSGAAAGALVAGRAGVFDAIPTGDEIEALVAARAA